MAILPTPLALTSGCAVSSGDLHRDVISGGQVLDKTHLTGTRVLTKRVGGSLKPYRGN